MSPVSMSVVLLSTVPSVDVGRNIGRKLLESKLIACVNIVPAVTSLYWWDGKINEDNESLLILKTSKALVEQVTSQIKSHHPYEVPEVISLPVEDGNDAYLKWISDSVKKSKDGRKADLTYPATFKPRDEEMASSDYTRTIDLDAAEYEDILPVSGLAARTIRKDLQSEVVRVEAIEGSEEGSAITINAKEVMATIANLEHIASKDVSSPPRGAYPAQVANEFEKWHSSSGPAAATRQTNTDTAAWQPSKVPNPPTTRPQSAGPAPQTTDVQHARPKTIGATPPPSFVNKATNPMGRPKSEAIPDDKGVIPPMTRQREPSFGVVGEKEEAPKESLLDSVLGHVLGMVSGDTSAAEKVSAAETSTYVTLPELESSAAESEKTSVAPVDEKKKELPTEDTSSSAIVGAGIIGKATEFMKHPISVMLGGSSESTAADTTTDDATAIAPAKGVEGRMATITTGGMAHAECTGISPAPTASSTASGITLQGADVSEVAPAQQAPSEPTEQGQPLPATPSILDAEKRVSMKIPRDTPLIEIARALLMKLLDSRTTPPSFAAVAENIPANLITIADEEIDITVPAFASIEETTGIVVSQLMNPRHARKVGGAGVGKKQGPELFGQREE
ncbi:hypothetical protein SeMB42_g03305 [Synchytrium endobioticum]|uniref:Divalent cation tolerance protein CutA n=1 Tax=Synchytrium endobioticum TaxID=286115 RepID=A0A507D7U4_9FUNG|nr:hypothetical protein SeMB42_g03305 [Synchytrium endobioticum]TPX49307.1 hypothetical protein SeLEV6574_g01567 [Synchytrium endobioticum]